MKYSIGSNLPGYMPDNEPSEADDLEQAKAILVADIDRCIECMHEYNEQAAESEQYLSEIVAAPAQVLSARIGDYVFWITEV